MKPRAVDIKVGALTVLAGVAGVAIALVLGIARMRVERFEYHTYFDESVQGLEIGSPVKYRGVSIGNVSQIAIAPDRRLVDVTLSVNAEPSQRLELDTTANLRARLGTQGITGVKYIDIEAQERPAELPVLTFPPHERYIPARPSVLKDLEERFGSLGVRMPELLDRIMATIEKVEVLVDDVNASGVVGSTARTIDDFDLLVRDVRDTVRGLDRARLPQRAASVLDGADRTLAQAREALGRIGGDAGLVASARRATDAFGDLGKRTHGSARELDRVLREIENAARAVRELVDEIERQPDILVKGRKRGGP